MVGVLTAPLLLAGVVVLGEGRDGCPDAGAVRERLEELAGDDGGGAPDALIFDGEAGALRVRLLSPEGSVREEKTLDLRGSCDELAEAVAALGVAWRSALRSHEVPPPVLVSEIASPPPPRAARPAPPPMSDFELSLGLQTTSGVERWAPGLLVGAQLPLRGPYNFGLTLDLSAPRTALDDVSTRWVWMQVRMVAGPSVRAVGSHVYVDAHLGLAGGIDVTLNDRPSGVTKFHRASPALVFGGRWTYRHSASMPWFGATTTIYLDPHLDSPVVSAHVRPERWMLGFALGAAVPFEAGR